MDIAIPTQRLYAGSRRREPACGPKCARLWRSALCLGTLLARWLGTKTGNELPAGGEYDKHWLLALLTVRE